MAKTCKKTFTDPNAIPLDRIVWTGEDLDCFDICNGDSITPLIFDIATRVCELLEVTDVTSTTICDDLVQKLGTQDKTIGNLLQLLLTESCSLRELIDTVQDESNSNNQLTLDFKCISDTDPCTDESPTNIQEVIQLIINAFCDIKTQFDEIVDTIQETVDNTITDYLDGIFESVQPNRIIKQDSPLKYIFRGFVPPNCPIPYFGSLSNFPGGVGTGAFLGWYICSGANGTVDMRGVVPIGAIQGIGGGTLQNYVNPSLNPMSPSTNYSVGDRGGSSGIALTINQIPSHTHTPTVTVNEQPHTHNVNYALNGNGGGGSNSAFTNFGNTDHSTTTPATTGLTVQVSNANIGGGQIHENRMPYLACAWIQMID